MSSDPARRSAAAELSVIAEALDRYAERIRSLLPPLTDGEHDDLVAVIGEAERQVAVSSRSVHRAYRACR